MLLLQNLKARPTWIKLYPSNLLSSRKTLKNIYRNKKYYWTKILYLAKNMFQKWRQNKDFWTNCERICNQQACSSTYIKEGTWSKGKIISDISLDFRNYNCLSKYNNFYHLIHYLNLYKNNPLRSDTVQRYHLLSFFFNIVMKVLPNVLRQEKEIQSENIRKEEIKPCLFSDHTIVLIENLKNNRKIPGTT